AGPARCRVRPRPARRGARRPGPGRCDPPWAATPATGRRRMPAGPCGGAMCANGSRCDSTRSVAVRSDEIAHLGVDLFAPAAAAEDAVVAGALHGQVLAIGSIDAGAQLVRGAGLARAGNVVELTFDGEQGGA